MNWSVSPLADLLISAVTAFIIAAGGAVAVVGASGNPVTTKVYELAAIVGAISAAKDMRSQLKLPPVTNGTGDTQIFVRQTPPPAPPPK